MHDHGNKVAKRTWLATWSPETCPAPDSADVKRLKDFMRRKYVVKECVGCQPSAGLWPSDSRRVIVGVVFRWYRPYDPARARADSKVCA
jgi:hypothetical protein